MNAEKVRQFVNWYDENRGYYEELVEILKWNCKDVPPGEYNRSLDIKYTIHKKKSTVYVNILLWDLWHWIEPPKIKVS